MEFNTFLYTKKYVNKKHQEPFLRINITKTAVISELLHIDLSGPFLVTSLGGFNYMLVIVDDNS